jgi:hypothetical protein
VEVSPSFTPAFGISPIFGRWFAGADVNPAIAMNGRSYTVTGVMPADFRFPLSTVEGGLLRNDIWVPVDPQDPRAGGRETRPGGTVIGLFPQMAYEEPHHDLQPGDILITFTDGVPEALNPGDGEFGEDRIRDSLLQFGHLPADELAARLAAELKTSIADAAQYDDLTFVPMKVS